MRTSKETLGALVDSQLIAHVKSLIHREQHIDTESITAQVKELTQSIERYDTAGFTARARKMRTQLSPLTATLKQEHQQREIARLKDAGYLVIDLPEWDGYYQRTSVGKYVFLKNKPSSPRLGFHHIPGKILEYGRCNSILCRLSGRKDCPNADCAALWMVQTQNFTSPVPDFVVDRVLEEQETFDQFDILFIAKKNELHKLVRDFDTVVDPILVGRWRVGEEYDFNTHKVVPIPSEHHAAVLAMWGDDLEEIDLVLALSQEAEG